MAKGTLGSIGTHAFANGLFVNSNGVLSGNGNITGFSIGTNNRLTPLTNGTRALSSNGNVNPGQVLFNPAGNVLVVSEKETNRIVTYTVGSNGVAFQLNSSCTINGTLVIDGDLNVRGSGITITPVTSNYPALIVTG